MRYVKQIDKYSCGPIAAINVAKWLGYKNTYADLAYFQFALKTYCPGGTSLYDFGRLMKDWGGKRMKQPTTVKMNRELQNKKCLVIQVSYNSGGGHFYIITDSKNKKWCCVNLLWGKTENWLSRREFCKEHRSVRELRVWTLSQETI